MRVYFGTVIKSNTIKDTKEIIEIKITTKEQIDALDKKDIFENQKVLIKNLFK